MGEKLKQTLLPSFEATFFSICKPRADLQNGFSSSTATDGANVL